MKKTLLFRLGAAAFTLSLLLSSMCFSPAFAAPDTLGGASAAPVDTVGINVDAHSQGEITAFIASHPLLYKAGKEVQYSSVPSVCSPYSAGAVQSQYLQDGLNAVNIVRYICGIPAEVSLDATYTDECQKASVLCAAMNKLEHIVPDSDRPTGMTDDFFSDAKKGTSQSNLYCWNGTVGYQKPPLSKTVIDAYIQDTDPGNRPMVGHRRWVLNPVMQKTGFGYAEKAETDNTASVYSSMYAFDNASAAVSDKFSVVAYPAQQTPVEFASSLYSLSLSSAFGALDKSNITVTMTRLSDGTVWSSSSASDTDLYVNNVGYGMPRCVIWDPSSVFGAPAADTAYSIVITGVTKRDSPYPISYNVNYFSAPPVAPSGSDSPDTPSEPAALTAPGSATAASAGYNSIQLSWNAVDGASGYEVWRKAPGTAAYRLLAATESTSYADGGLATGSLYSYQVRAYRDGATRDYSGWSVEVSAKPAPSTPDLGAVPVNYNSIKLNWGAVAGATRYELYRATSPGSSFRLLLTTASRSYLNTGLLTVQPYYYRVRAYRLVGYKKIYSGYSGVATAQTSLNGVPWLSAARLSATSIRLNWGAVPGVTQYQVYRATSPDGPFALVAVTSSRRLNLAKLTTGQTYYFQVRAYRASGRAKAYGEFSPLASVTP